MKDTSNDFVIGDKTNGGAIKNETLDFQPKSHSNDFGTVTVGGNSTRQKQVFENKNDNRIRKAADSAVMNGENWTLDAILTAMDKLVHLRVEMAVKSTAESSGRGSSRVVQNPDQKIFHR